MAKQYILTMQNIEGRTDVQGTPTPTPTWSATDIYKRLLDDSLETVESRITIFENDDDVRKRTETVCNHAMILGFMKSVEEMGVYECLEFVSYTEDADRFYQLIIRVQDDND